MKKKFFIFLIVVLAVFSLASCGSKTKTLKIDDDVIIEYDFKSFENIEPGIYQVKYIKISSDSASSYMSPAELYVTENKDSTKSFYIQYITEYGKTDLINISGNVIEALINKQ